ncbi:hypothetical protein [Salinimonas sediminis]|uniref:Uncharacterized protein n=1 Tax=Salinimonas sediminis TaxID=2303538 RepID=A0A346NPF1_9ALTE|nr:hypothetical protein [Salinimonas sediminis]AXR07408.1 hypothetical protein D0Y50_14240 [Salinimonas sediminis]
MVGILAALLLTSVGLGILLAGWRGRLRRVQQWYKPVGWACIALSPWLWHTAYGWRFALAYWVLTVICCALLMTYLQRDIRPAINLKPRPRVAVPAAPIVRATGKHLLSAIVVLPLAGMVSMLSTVAVTRHLPWASVNIIALGVYLMPLWWGALAYWAMADTKRWRPPACLAMLGAVCYSLLYL